MRALFVLLVTVATAAISIAEDLAPKDLVTQLYQAHGSKHDPLGSRLKIIARVGTASSTSAAITFTNRRQTQDLPVDPKLPSRRADGQQDGAQLLEKFPRARRITAER